MIYFINPYRYGTVEGGLEFITDQSSLSIVGVKIKFTVGSFDVDWGDGGGTEVLVTNVEKTHNYGSTGTYTIKIIGESTDITEIIFDTSKLTSASGLELGALSEFALQSNLLTGTIDLSNIVSFANLRLNNNANLTGISNPTTATAVGGYRVNNCDLTGTLDISGLTGLAGSFFANNNPNLTGISNPTSSSSIINYRAEICDLTGTLDLSGLTSLGGIIFIYNNSNLTAVTNPSSSQSVSWYQVINCDITGTFDISGFSSFGGRLVAFNNPNMTAVTNPTSSNSFTHYQVSGCDLTGTLDVSGLTGLAGIFDVFSNSNLTGLTMPSTAGIFSVLNCFTCDLGYVDLTVLSGTNDNISILFQNNNMTTTEVNHILVDLDNTGWIDGSINISGTNAAPDGSSGGFDGDQAVINLVANGWTVTTS